MSKYQLIEKKSSPFFKVTITGDVNDADYLTTVREYPKTRFEKLVDELILLKSLEGKYNEPDDMEREWLVDVPYDSESGMWPHTIESVEVEYFDENGKLWDVKLN